MKKIITYPNKILLEKSKSIFNKKKIFKIEKNLRSCLLETNGIGISSPQIGINKRIFLIKTSKKKTICFINPVILYNSKNVFKSIEGCLSIPFFYESIIRYSFILLKYLNIKLKKKKIFLKGVFSACAQHEIDHLNGILINMAR